MNHAHHQPTDHNGHHSGDGPDLTHQEPRDHPTARPGPDDRPDLHREVAGTIALLTDTDDFTAMRRYRTFPYDDHHTYLHHLDALLTTRAARGRHTTLALFDPDDYAAYCTDTGLDPDTPTTRGRYTAHLAATTATVPYDGRPLSDLVPDLVNAAVRHATWEYATEALATLGPCPTCHDDIGWACYAHAGELLLRILTSAGTGHHHLVCSVATNDQTLLTALRADTPAGATVPDDIDPTEAQEFATLLALGIATKSGGGLVLRTAGRPDAQDRVCGWRLDNGHLTALTASEVFDAYCTDAESGDLLSPEPGLDYTPPPTLGTETPPPPHHH
ncbi:hypothetical protein [Streptomyces sp. NPDC058045]|uniref:hypothetical protein n=1 Tax=Streptomyces sp. NPDC058045 TaxID=3346311 RepID=UPI0036E80625